MPIFSTLSVIQHNPKKKNHRKLFYGQKYDLNLCGMTKYRIAHTILKKISKYRALIHHNFKMTKINTVWCC